MEKFEEGSEEWWKNWDKSHEPRLKCPECEIELTDNAWNIYPELVDGKVKCGCCNATIPYFLAKKIYVKYRD